MTSSQAEFWRKGVRRGKGTPCPKLLWVYIKLANKRYEPWDVNSGERPRMLLRILARSPTPFPSKNPDLKKVLRSLDLEWLTPAQISRIRECPAPRRKQPRHQMDRLFGWGGVDPRSPVRSPRCKRIFWAWRADQKTCDSHWWCASMLRVEKHRKAKKDDERKRLQLKNARQQLKRVRRATRQSERILAAQSTAKLGVEVQSEMTDFRLLQWINLGFVQAASDTDSDRLKAMIRGGYVVQDKAKSQTYKLSGKGLQLLGQLRRRVGVRLTIH